MKRLTVFFVSALAIQSLASAQTDRESTQNRITGSETTHSPGAAREIGGGAGTIGLGAAKGVGHVAEGTARGAVDIVTLHPIKGTTNIAKGAVEGGKDVTVGAAKGTGKIGKGVGKTFKRIF